MGVQLTATHTRGFVCLEKQGHLVLFEPYAGLDSNRIGVRSIGSLRLWASQQATKLGGLHPVWRTRAAKGPKGPWRDNARQEGKLAGVEGGRVYGLWLEGLGFRVQWLKCRGLRVRGQTGNKAGNALQMRDRMTDVVLALDPRRRIQ